MPEFATWRTAVQVDCDPLADILDSCIKGVQYTGQGDYLDVVWRGVPYTFQQRLELSQQLVKLSQFQLNLFTQFRPHGGVSPFV